MNMNPSKTKEKEKEKESNWMIAIGLLLLAIIGLFSIVSFFTKKKSTLGLTLTTDDIRGLL